MREDLVERVAAELETYKEGEKRVMELMTSVRPML
jgi:hypothetical protein